MRSYCTVAELGDHMLRIRACAFVAGLAAIIFAHDSPRAGQTAIHVIWRCAPIDFVGIESMRPMGEVKVDGRVTHQLRRCTNKIIPVKPGTHKINVREQSLLNNIIDWFDGPEYQVRSGQTVFILSYWGGKYIMNRQLSAEEARTEIANQFR
jgi:hypothetical protein